MRPVPSRILPAALAVLVLASGTARAAAPRPWAERCQLRLRALVPALAPLGQASVVLHPGAPTGRVGERARFGDVSLQLATRAGVTWVASAGDDHSGHRHREPIGLREKRYEVWHSAYEDALDGEPRADELRAERHHRLAVGVLGAEVRGMTAPRKGASRAERDAFQAAVTPVLEACLADVLPLEDNPSLAWTTQCLAELGGAYVVAVAHAPSLVGGACREAPYEAACGRLDGRSSFNALLLIGGQHADARATWTAEAGVAQRERLGDSAMIWAHAATDAEWTALRAAFEAPLADCVALSWAARRR